MSSLFKTSFHSIKQSKEFTDIATKAIPCISRDTAKCVYKAIKNGKNLQWNSTDLALSTLIDKIKLNQQIQKYQQIINDKETNSLREIQSAKTSLAKLTINDSTAQLIQNLERGFDLQKGTLTPQTILNSHLIPTSKYRKRSCSVTQQNGLVAMSKNGTPASQTTSASVPCHRDRYKNRSIAVTMSSLHNNLQNQNSDSMQIQSQTQENEQKSVAIDGEQNTPKINTRQYLQYLLERALSNKTWNDNDADHLCQCAIDVQCDWITVHSMWVNKCNRLLTQYTNKKYPATHHEIESHTKICVAIGYPLGQTSTVCKVAETTQAVLDGAQRIRLMVSAGKVLLEDWDYIIHEVRSIVNAALGVDVRIVFPDTPEITAEIKQIFNAKIMHEMGQKKFGEPIAPKCPLQLPPQSQSQSQAQSHLLHGPLLSVNVDNSSQDESDCDDDDDDDIDVDFKFDANMKNVNKSKYNLQRANSVKKRKKPKSSKNSGNTKQRRGSTMSTSLKQKAIVNVKPMLTSTKSCNQKSHPFFMSKHEICEFDEFLGAVTSESDESDSCDIEFVGNKSKASINQSVTDAVGCNYGQSQLQLQPQREREPGQPSPKALSLQRRQSELSSRSRKKSKRKIRRKSKANVSDLEENGSVSRKSRKKVRKGSSKKRKKNETEEGKDSLYYPKEGGKKSKKKRKSNKTQKKSIELKDRNSKKKAKGSRKVRHEKPKLLQSPHSYRDQPGKYEDAHCSVSKISV